VKIAHLIKSPLIAAAILALFIPATTVLAADVFNLTYTLTEGGSVLELNQPDTFKGVRLQIDSNVSTRYQVVQRVVSPLLSRDNPSQSIKDNFVYRGLRGSNQYGDLRVPVSDSALRNEEIIYVSDASGHADSFTLAYGLVREDTAEPGYYSGKIAYTLTPISSVRAPVTLVLDVFVTVSAERKGSPKIEITTSLGGTSILLNPGKEDRKTADVAVKINGNFRKPFSIGQMLARPIESQTGSRLDERKVNFVVRQAKIGVAENMQNSLGRGMQNIYDSSPSGAADNYFVITYGLGDFSDVVAGRYRTSIQYWLDEMGKQSNLGTLELEIESDPVFDIKITPVDQRYAIEFQNVKASEPPRVSEVLIEVLSNTGRQYQLNQEVLSELTNKEGDTVPTRYFTMRTESLNTKGKLRMSSFEEVQKGSTVLLISDDRGSADQFKIVYQLESPKDIKAGDYSTKITYSLTEL